MTNPSMIVCTRPPLYIVVAIRTYTEGVIVSGLLWRHIEKMETTVEIRRDKQFFIIIVPENFKTRIAVNIQNVFNQCRIKTGV